MTEHQDIEAMKAELREKRAQEQELNQKCQELRQQIANAQAAWKIGDKVTYDGAKNVWQITGIEPDFNNDPRYLGVKLKKNGEPGAQSFLVRHIDSQALRAVESC